MSVPTDSLVWHHRTEAIMRALSVVVSCLAGSSSTVAFQRGGAPLRPGSAAYSTETAETVASPFEGERVLSPDEQFPLTEENVEMVLDELRPYLISDGGNVRIAAIEGPVVKLELEGACGTCPSSTMTMKMGLERRLKEAIPEISDVVQYLPDTPDMTDESIDEVLEGVRPFLSVAGGTVDLVSLSGVGGAQPTVILRLEGKSASLNSVKQEISQRIHRHFMIAGLRVDWDDDES